MNRWFAASIFAAFAVVPAHSEPFQPQSFVLPEPQAVSRKVDLRIVEDPVFAATPIHNSGMIAQTPVAPNASLGIGLLRAATRRAGSGEYRADPGAPSSRKAAVRFVLKF